eukprot:1137180-Pelagomonas_calceolata.AAC.2
MAPDIFCASRTSRPETSVDPQRDAGTAEEKQSKAVLAPEQKSAEPAASSGAAEQQTDKNSNIIAAAAAAAAAREKEASQDVDSLMAAKINAVAGKINAARELARRLAEEKNAAIKPLASPEDVHAAEAASAAAAAQAARADSLARALRKAEQTNDQLRRLKVKACNRAHHFRSQYGIVIVMGSSSVL